MNMRNLQTTLAILLLWSGPCGAQSLARVERPQINVGDASVFEDLNVVTGEKRDTNFRVLVVDADKIIVETSGSTSGTRTFTRDWNLVEIKTGDIVTQSAKPFWPHLQFPLAVGQKWETPFEIETTDRSAKRNSKWQWNAHVVAEESVTVPAGTFAALKVEYDATFATREANKAWTGTQKETIWYAPQAGRIVRREFVQSVPVNHFIARHVDALMSFMPVQ